ncbi:MAG: thioredoxin family protein [Oscillospiraceae bacterium]|jgi:thioredoxin 1|nr:thioredoxin family protein [Oscillospiraceae bacterium]
MPIVVHPKTFQSEVLDAKKPVLVDFYGSKCIPCRLQMPILLELAEQYGKKIKFCMFNTDREPNETDADFETKFRTILEYSVMSLPTLLIFADGELLRTLIGLHTKEDLLGIFDELGLHLDEDDSGDR